MIKVLVAEDEPPIMRAIIATIEQSNLEFKVVATAINGKKAIEELSKQPIDVVFTDICMPVMDGLVLAEHIKNNYTNTLTVVVSGFQDFEYARKAIEFKVYDYLLKPISKDKLSQLLKNIENEISQKLYKKKKDMLSNVMTQNNMGTLDSECIVLLIYAGAMLTYGNDILVPAIGFWDKVSIESIVSQVLRENEGYIVFHGNSVSERIIVIEPTSSQRKQEIAEEIFKELVKTNEIAITIACRSGIKLSEAGATFHKLRECVSRNIVLPKSQILYCNDLNESYEDVSHVYSKEQFEYITRLIGSADVKKLKDYILEIFKSMQDSDVTQEDVTRFLDRIVNHYYFEAQSADKKESTIKREIYGAIANFFDYTSLADDVVSILSTIKTEDKVKNEKQPKLIENIENYIIRNYSNSITNTVLSKEFGFVPSYISRLFRQYKGVSPSEYLTQYRIEKAKQIMREDPNLLVKEIADMVGFKEAYYFSKTFKKETGIWPSDYHG